MKHLFEDRDPSTRRSGEAFLKPSPTTHGDNLPRFSTIQGRAMFQPCTEAWYIRECIHMPTTIHIPSALLKSVDQRAKALGLSRNRLIVRALERVVSERSTWAPEFLERLRSVDHATVAAVDELLADVKQARRSKPPRDL